MYIKLFRYRGKIISPLTFETLPDDATEVLSHIKVAFAEADAEKVGLGAVHHPYFKQ